MSADLRIIRACSSLIDGRALGQEISLVPDPHVRAPAHGPAGGWGSDLVTRLSRNSPVNLNRLYFPSPHPHIACACVSRRKNGPVHGTSPETCPQRPPRFLDLERRHFSKIVFRAHAVVKPLESFIIPFVACSAQIGVEQTDSYYRPPRCACASRVNKCA